MSAKGAEKLEEACATQTESPLSVTGSEFKGIAEPLGKKKAEKACEKREQAAKGELIIEEKKKEKKTDKKGKKSFFKTIFSGCLGVS